MLKSGIWLAGSTAASQPEVRLENRQTNMDLNADFT